MEYRKKEFNGISYFELGNGNELFVLLSGWGTVYSLADMYHLATQLSTNARVIIIDRPGYEKSTEKIEERTFENVTKEIASIIGHESPLVKIILVGHSLGGAYALAFAMKYPQMVKSIVCLDMIPYVGIGSSVAYRVSYIPATIFQLLRVTGFLKLLNKNTVKRLLKIQNIPFEIAAEAVHRTYTSLYNRHVMSELKALTPFIKGLKINREQCPVPVLVIFRNQMAGLMDKALPLLAERYASVSMVNVGTSSHDIHIEKVNAVVESINEYYL